MLKKTFIAAVLISSILSSLPAQAGDWGASVSNVQNTVEQRWRDLSFWLPLKRQGWLRQDDSVRTGGMLASISPIQMAARPA